MSVAPVTPVQRQSVRETFKRPAWLRTEILAGLVVALALIPEAIAFALIADVDPKVGLYAAAIMAMSIAFLGGRPAMISAATAATALVIAPVVASHGVEYLFATVILAGILQILFGVIGVAKLMRFIPQSVMTGFVNALAILIFVAQLPDLIDVPWAVYPLFALGLAIIFLSPRVTAVIPAPLVAIVVVTLIVVIFSIDVPTVEDKGELPSELPVFLIPDVPFTLETLQVILPAALTMAVVGLLESLMTAQLVDNITDTGSSKTRESVGQGGANILSGFFGGMGGCAMIGQTMINVRASGARTRISTFVAGVFLMILSVGLGDIVGMMPMAVLVAVMVYVAYATFEWHSIAPRTLKNMPVSETVIMLITVIPTVVTGNLAIGVGLGVLAAMIAFVRRVSHFAKVTRSLDDQENTATYLVTGQLFFASSHDLANQFDYALDPDNVVIDLRQANIWDQSTAATLDAIHERYSDRGKTVEFLGLRAPFPLGKQVS
ncbi:SulP family inorganic anion transporter [Yaniella flava]|uniref:SulP family inorganic anion transporter n=1 Tax=Yaniella flava TaxID=287930 RepID=A0ABN2U495_9MICC